MTRLWVTALLACIAAPVLAETKPWSVGRPLAGPIASPETTYARPLVAGEGAMPVAPLAKPNGGLLGVQVWSDSKDGTEPGEGQDASFTLLLRTSQGWYALPLFRRMFGFGEMNNRITTLAWEKAAPSILRVEYVDGMLEGAMEGAPAKDHYRDQVVFCSVGVSAIPSCTAPLTLRDDDNKDPKRVATATVDANGKVTIKKHPTLNGRWTLVFP